MITAVLCVAAPRRQWPLFFLILFFPHKDVAHKLEAPAVVTIMMAPLWLRLGLRNHRQLCGIPCGEASGHLDQMRDPMLMQDAGGDRRAVAARAMDGDAAVAGDFGDALLQMVERNIHAALNMPGHPLARISDIQQ